KHLRGLSSLTKLDIRNTQVGDAGLEHLKGLTRLEMLYYRNANVTDAGVKKLRQALPNCVIGP
ncbi:MAG TPA: hypothetical protein VNA25_03425, partial [Phycisphaerae bacterium]|nr:hypothetical protein [Phycisphaerae bacterium]